jgi:nitronate monooxygenase
MLPSLTIKGKTIPLPIIQGGMGVGVSLARLAKAVAREGGAGIISSAVLDRLVSKRTGKTHSTYSAVREEVGAAKTDGGYVGLNVMVALMRDFRDSVRGAIDAGADAIISGGGLPLNLPAVQDPKSTALIPIVSSARSLALICRKWERLGYRPDAAVLEGPLAGGHLGFSVEELDSEECKLENLLPPVKDVAQKFGDFPVIAAGGIFSHQDIVKFMHLGADGVQMGTRFLATEESSATPAYKQAVVDATEADIVVAHRPGSPCGLPFRVIKQSAMFLAALRGLRIPKCNYGYLLRKDEEGRYSRCAAKEEHPDHFCICSGLLRSAGYCLEHEELFTVGTNAWRVDRILSVKEVMRELLGEPVAVL